MVPSALGEALEALRTASHEERSQFIVAFFASLRPSERHFLQTKLVEDKYFFDVFGSLPVEISLQIAEYLHPNEVICLRRVSSRWKFLLSSKPLARKMAQTHYSNRSDFSSYAHQLNQDAFSALRNLTFREHAGRRGRYKLKYAFKLTPQHSVSMRRPDDSYFKVLNVSASLNYAIFAFDDTQYNRTHNTSKWYIMRMKGGSGQGPIPLANRQREDLENALAHVGDSCAAGVTLSSCRVLVWSLQGNLIREFKLMHEGGMSMTSSEKYFFMRNGNVADSSSDYYLLNLEMSTLQTFEQFPEFIQTVTGNRRSTTPSMKILDGSNQIILVGLLQEANILKAAVSWMTFNEEEGTLVETIGKVIDYDIGHLRLGLSCPLVFRFQNNKNVAAVGVPCTGDAWDFGIGGDVLPEGEVACVWMAFYSGRGYRGPPVLCSFRYGETVYTVMKTSEGNNNKYSLTCNRTDPPTMVDNPRLLDLAELNGRFRDLTGDDECFIFFDDEGFHIFEWLDFDRFAELGGLKEKPEIPMECAELAGTTF
ncbi:hypothetical protein TWF730_007204 [Orbilia blumenaviensis]|uniref:F-box domain-containing protein n=1 Tax=Orbilia blumenaviensis TaxID=1796055 RepID=A0AAV9VAX8_9PEZI